MNWNDVKYFLAIARGGTLSAAAQQLSVNQTTVTRRIQAFEQAMSVQLFHKENGRQVLTDMGKTVFSHAEALELNVLAISHAVSDNDAALSGIVRITAVESLINSLIIPNMPDFHTHFANVTAEFVAENDNLFIERREADIAIRLARPEEGNMIISKLGNVGFSIYRAHKDRHLTQQADWQDLPWVTYNASLSHIAEMKWLRENLSNLKVNMTTSSAASLASAIQSGAGVGILPCLLGDKIDGVERISGPDPLMMREAWLILHKDLVNTPRIRQTANWLKELVAKNRYVLDGQRPA